MRAMVRINAQDSPEMLETVLNSETDDELSRCKVDVSRQESDIVISLAADDIVALRAALNSYLRWAKLAIDSNDAIGGI